MSTQDSIEVKRLLLGCNGWEHTTWDAGYYPDDLPRDWQLSYYANDADCVLLPATRWREASCDDLVAWRDDVPPGFLFFLELEADEPDEAELTLVSALGDALGGLVGQPLVSGVAVPAAVPSFSEGGGSLPAPRRGVLLLDVAGRNLRKKREMLERAEADTAGFEQIAIILAAPDLVPSDVTEFRQLAELMDFA